MDDLRSKLSLDGSDFNKTLDDAGKSVNDFNNQTKNASKQVDDLGKSTKRTASELLNEMKSMENLGRSTSNYRSQLAQMTKQIQDLTINYRAMSDEMKNSDFGREVASQIQELTSKASQMKDTIQDATNSVKMLASDTAKLDATKSVIQGLSAGFTLVASTGLLGANSTEKMVRVMARLKTIEQATNAVITIANLLNKDSNVILMIKNAQTKAATIANTKLAASTGAATVAQKAFNVAAKANPYVLLATAILTVVGAMALFSKETEDTTYDMAEYETAADKMRKQNEKLADSYSKTAGTMLSKFEMMRLKWNELASDMEKDKFVKDNIDNFKELGLKIDDAVDAEKAFTEQSAVIIKAFNLRAEAAAYAAEATLQYQEAIRNKKLGGNTTFKAGDKIPESWSEADKQFYSDWAKPDKNGNYFFSGDETLLKMANNQYNVDAAKARLDAQEMQKKSIELEAQANQLLKEQGLILDDNNDKRNNGGRNEETFETGSVAYYDKLIGEVNKKLKNEKLTYEEIVELQKKIKDLELERYRAQTGKAGYEVELIPELKPKKLEDKLKDKKLEDKLKDTTLKVNLDPAVNERTFFTFNEKIADTVGGLNSINNAVNSIGKAIEGMNAEWDDSKTAVENITSYVGSFFSMLQSVTSVIETINTLSKIWSGLTLSEWIIQKRKNQEKMKELGIDTAETGVKSTNLGLETGSALATLMKSAGSIPVIGWVIALGLAAAVIAMIRSAKNSAKFASGGIVPGNSYTGDQISAQLNSGEMVLNTQQQKNLFNLLNNVGGTSNGQSKVEFVIKGQDLKGVLTNYDKKMSRI